MPSRTRCTTSTTASTRASAGEPVIWQDYRDDARIAITAIEHHVTIRLAASTQVAHNEADLAALPVLAVIRDSDGDLMYKQWGRRRQDDYWAHVGGPDRPSPVHLPALVVHDPGRP